MKKLGEENICYIKMYYNNGRLTIKSVMVKGAKKQVMAKARKPGTKPIFLKLIKTVQFINLRVQTQNHI